MQAALRSVDSPPPAPTAAADVETQLVDLLRRNFFNRTDAIGYFVSDHPVPKPIDSDAMLEEHLRLHVRGKCRVGSYAPGRDQKTLWTCIDLDGGAEHAHALVDPEGVAVAMQKGLGDNGVPSYLERSGGGCGYHLWIFHEVPVNAGYAKKVGIALSPKTAPLIRGGSADPASNAGIEVFPKQAKIAKDGYGNMVYLPFWGAAQNGGAQFYEVSAEGHLTRFVPTELKRLSDEMFEKILGAVLPLAPPAPQPKSRPRAAGGEAPQPESAKEAYAQWRIEALQTLNLADVYGEWLTGKCSSQGWLECRDPSSPTGDRNPSAGVADTTGSPERGTFHTHRTGESMSVFDFLISQNRAADFREARSLVAELSGVPLPQRPDEELPSIITTGRQLRDVIEDGWSAVVAANRPSPSLFRRGDRLVRLEHGERGEPRVEPADRDYLLGLLLRSANWFRQSKQGEEIPATPPPSAPSDMLKFVDERLPILDGIGASPMFSSSGVLMSSAGYYPDEHYLIGGFDQLTIALPATPSAADVERARTLIVDDLLGDFPFVSETDRAHTIAALLLPFARRLVKGCTPLHVIQAPAPGSGKGLLCDAISIVATGQTANARALSASDDEVRKMVAAELERARPIILLDNVDSRSRGKLDSPTLAAVLTAERYTDRRLGKTEMMDVLNSALWMMTGNNPTFSSELARRTVRVRLDAATDKPWKRSGFRHPRLKDWVQANRSVLVSACLTLIQHWICSGRPQGDEIFGSFEDWSGVLGGIVAEAGIPGFLGNSDQIYEEADVEGQEWREFVVVWNIEHGMKPIGVSLLNALCVKRDLMMVIRGDGNGTSQITRLGQALLASKDRIFSGFRIAQAADHGHHGKQYKLVPIASA